jgi:hypothetical protein
MKYADLDYSGHGHGEYMYYPLKKNNCKNDACQPSDTDRCVRMDCHETTTGFSLLGVFKEPDYGTFLEQLFKYEGGCLWTDDEYKFMQYNRDAWPQECTQSDDYLYYDTKPGVGGTMDIGLYQDAQCRCDYTGDTTVEEVLFATTASPKATLPNCTPVTVP